MNVQYVISEESFDAAGNLVVVYKPTSPYSRLIANVKKWGASVCLVAISAIAGWAYGENLQFEGNTLWSNSDRIIVLQSQKKALTSANAVLTAELTKTQAELKVKSAALSNALIPEATAGEAFNNHVWQPIKSTAVSVGAVVAESSKSAYATVAGLF